MHSTRNARHPAASLLIFAALALSVTGCATRSVPTLPAVVTPPQIPSPPLVSEPLPSGAYLMKACEFRKTLRLKLNLSQPASERCETLGLTKP